MTKKKTIEIFKDIHNPAYSKKEKLEAINNVIMLGMCNKVSKHDIISTFAWVIEWYLTDGEE